MIISRTPYRISLFGGGTDYPAWYRKHGGSVIAATIDKYCYLSVRHLPPFFGYRYLVIWSKIETCMKRNEIQHPAVKAVLEHLEIDRGLEVHHMGDLPARSGMGSSSAFTVGMLNAVYSLCGRMISKQDLAMEAIHIEQNVLRETVGSQDQVSAAYGGFNRIDFAPNGSITVTPITVSTERINNLSDHLLLFYTGIARTSSNLSKSFLQQIDEKKRELRIMKDLVDESISLLNSECDIMDFGELLLEAWDAKKHFSKKVSNEELENIYCRAIEAGALSGKITGAGGGGFLLLFVEPKKQQQVKESLKEFIHVPFNFEYSGSQIIFTDIGSDYRAEDIARVFQPIRAFRELSELENR
jgi:D-glycero-alpha-D-manno-heptose-7-phosphate kinase